MQQSLADQLQAAKIKLEANDNQLAHHLRLELGQFKALASGAKVLPLKDRKNVTKRILRLYDICGLECK